MIAMRNYRPVSEFAEKHKKLVIFLCARAFFLIPILPTERRKSDTETNRACIYMYIYIKLLYNSHI